MELAIYQVDAFASEVFEGNPAAVCPLDRWLPDGLMQDIAAENNLSETAFLVEQDYGYRLRWFTPTMEVDLCGHATLASAHVLYEHLGYDGRDMICFDTNSGPLEVQQKGKRLEMDFPAAELNIYDPPSELEDALQFSALEAFKDTDILYIVENEQQIRSLDPDFTLLKEVDTRGVIVTALADSDEYDFVSRFFAPAAGIDEDPVTGSAHTMLTPFWGRRLNRQKLIGRQISRRGGTVFCEHKGGRVLLGGEAYTFMKGQIVI